MSIIKMRDIFHKCKKFSPSGTGRNKKKRRRIVHTSTRGLIFSILAECTNLFFPENDNKTPRVYTK